jgi:hypothetical protein
MMAGISQILSPRFESATEKSTMRKMPQPRNINDFFEVVPLKQISLKKSLNPGTKARRNLNINI